MHKYLDVLQLNCRLTKNPEYTLVFTSQTTPPIYNLQNPGEITQPFLSPSVIGNQLLISVPTLARKQLPTQKLWILLRQSTVTPSTAHRCRLYRSPF